MVSIEHTILSNLVYNEDYCKQTQPFLREEYFHSKSENLVYSLISEYINKYNKRPSIEALEIDLENVENIEQNTYDESKSLIQGLSVDEKSDIKWLVDNTEKFCQDKAVYNALMKSVQILDGKNKQEKGNIEYLLRDALAVKFDTHIGHNWREDFRDRFDFYHRVETKVPFDIHYLNLITNGGLTKKTLNVIMGRTGGGKSAIMCHMAAANLRQGKNVLYITLEMSEERIGERIDANLLGLTIDEVNELSKYDYEKRIDRVLNKFAGNIIIHEYPTASAGVANFRFLLNELKNKNNFVPDIIYVDYLNICASSRVKYSQKMDSYTYVKMVAEELRGLATEFDLPIVSATQTNRGGLSSSDLEMEDTSESVGLIYTVDLLLAFIRTEELDNMNQIMFKQLKNRYKDENFHRRFMVGMNRAMMTMYDLEEEAQNGLMDDRPVMDNSDFGERYEKDFDMSMFDSFK